MTASAAAAGCSGQSVAGVFDDGRRDAGSELGSEQAPLLSRVKWIGFGDDLKDRHGARRPVTAQRAPGIAIGASARATGGRRRLALHPQRLGVPAGQPDRRVMARGEERLPQDREPFVVRQGQVADAERAELISGGMFLPEAAARMSTEMAPG